MGLRCFKNGERLWRKRTLCFQRNKRIESWNHAWKEKKDTFITMENPSMWNSCIGLYTQRISSVSTEQSQIGVKCWKERNPRKEKILVMNWIGGCWKSRNPRDLSCSRCLATIKAHTPIEQVLNVHMSKLCDVHSIEVQIESKIMEGHTSWVLVCTGIGCLWKNCTPSTTKSTVLVLRCWRMIPNQSCWLQGFTVLGNPYLILRIHEPTNGTAFRKAFGESMRTGMIQDPMYIRQK